MISCQMASASEISHPIFTEQISPTPEYSFQSINKNLAGLYLMISAEDLRGF